VTKKAWVTGASKGIGRQLAIDLAHQGWHVAATARTESDLRSLLVETERSAGEIFLFTGDITDCSAMEILVEQIENVLGNLDLAILNAGTYIRFGVDNFSAPTFSKQIEVNLLGTVNCLAPVMQRMKNRNHGHLVVISSLSAYRGLPKASAYGASKAALTNMCEALKPELDERGVHLSVVHPGFVKTSLTDKNEFPMPFLIDVKVASQRILSGITRKKFEITFPSRFAFLLKITRCLPYILYFKITKRLLA
jgi:short-subunit dehydrogenase